MKRAFLLLAFFIVNSSVFILNSFAKEKSPDTVSVGIYVTSIHDVDFRQKEYSINLWLWLKYKRQEFDSARNLEIPMAKKFEVSYATTDTLDDGRIYMLMKLQCAMKGTWKIDYFPFDRQRLRFAIENSMYDASELVFTKDTAGKHYGKYFLMAWEKDSFNIKTEIKEYETGFGDPDLPEPHAEYSTYKVTVVVHRESWELFFKIFLGMYISFFISVLCFSIPHDKMDSRLALSVGSLFAVIGNKYIIDSSLPESNTFTLVDWLHAITLFYIFFVIVFSIITLKRSRDNEVLAKKFNRNAGWALSVIYILLNIWLIYRAYNSEAFG